MNKKIKATLYMESKIILKNHKFNVIHDPEGYLFSEGIYRTKILPVDLPEWYVYGYLYRRHGYISAKGVKHLLYKPNYFVENHLFKYDILFISYDEKIEPNEDEYGNTWYRGYRHALGGNIILDFANTAERFSDFDLNKIQKEIERKMAWYYEHNPPKN